MSSKTVEWPYLDFSLYAPEAPQPSDEQLKQLGEQIMDKFKKFGFVLLRNTGIPQHPGLKKIVGNVQNLIKLPHEVKSNVHTNSSDGYLMGYFNLGAESFGRFDGPADTPVDIKEGFTYTPGYSLTYPKQVPNMEKDFDDFHKHMLNFALRILESVALSLGKERMFFHQFFSDVKARKKTWNNLRVAISPPTEGMEIKARQMLCGDHTDIFSIVTTLIQEPGKGGLMCRLPDGQWVEPPVDDDTAYVQVGDYLEFWTAGKVKAQRHKVPVFTDERCKDSRWSVAFFSAPDNEAPLAPIDGSGTYNQYSGDTSKAYTDKLLNSYNERNALRFTE